MRLKVSDVLGGIRMHMYKMEYYTALKKQYNYVERSIFCSGIFLS